MFGWFFNKKELNRIEEETKKGFESVKKDIFSVSGWIKHLDSEKKLQNKEIENISKELSSIKLELKELGNVLSVTDKLETNKLFKTPKRVSKKQTAVYAVQTGVQTGVQTPNFDDFSLTERAIIWVLLNADMKLSYDDLAAMLGKEKSTIRGQINTIKQKKGGFIQEDLERNGKKRVYIHENHKEKILKKSKVSVNKNKKPKKKYKKVRN